MIFKQQKQGVISISVEETLSTHIPRLLAILETAFRQKVPSTKISLLLGDFYNHA